MSIKRFIPQLYITHIYSGEKDKCSALVTRNNKIRLLEHKVMIIRMNFNLSLRFKICMTKLELRKGLM